MSKSLQQLSAKYVKPRELGAFFMHHGLSFDMEFEYDLSNYTICLTFGKNFEQMHEYYLDYDVVKMLFDSFSGIKIVGIKLKLNIVQDELEEVFRDLGLECSHLKRIELMGCDGVLDIGVLERCCNLESFIASNCYLVGVVKLRSTLKLRRLGLNKCVCDEVLELCWWNLCVINIVDCEGIKMSRECGKMRGIVVGIDEIGYFDECRIKKLCLDGRNKDDAFAIMKMLRVEYVEHVVVRRMGMINWSAFGGMNLKYLAIHDCAKICEIDLRECLRLKTLIVVNCYNLSNILAKGLVNVDVTECALRDLDFLDECVESVRIVNCFKFKIMVGEIRRCSRLRKLHLVGCEGVSDLEMIGGCVGLRDFVVAGFYGLTLDVGALGGCVGLECVRFGGVELVDVGVLVGFVGLRVVEIADCVLKSVDFLGKCVGLESIYLVHCLGFEEIGDLSMCRLNTLRVEECSSLKRIGNVGECVRIFIKGCHMVKNLDCLIGFKLEYVEIALCNGLEELALMMPKLRFVNVIYCEKLLRIEGVNCGLMSFYMKRCYMVDNVDCLAKCCRLNNFVLSDCGGLRGLGKLGKLGKLRSIIIENCANVCDVKDMLNGSMLICARVTNCPNALV